MHSPRRVFISALLFVASLTVSAQTPPPPAPAPSLPPHSACGNGDFESLLTTKEWSGGHGCVPSTGVPSFPAANTGLFPDDLFSPDAHQKQVDVGNDPIVGISQVAPVGLLGSGSSLHAVRIGNAITGGASSCNPAGGTERLSKTFTVTQGIVRFWYAAVLQNPAGHADHQQPSFYVVVKDATGVVIPGLVNLGNGSGELVAKDDPFFQNTTQSGEVIRYRDWSCAQIDLSSKLGQVVTVEFVAEDCALGGHWGYAYVDNFCGSCGQGVDLTGSLSFNQAASSACGRGKICFDYTLPKAGGTTGSVAIRLDIIQNSAVIHSIQSGVKSSGTQFCFDIDPATIPGLSTAAGAFDFAATGTFMLNTSATPKSEGSLPDGVKSGANNDYRISCDEGCCPSPNLLRNGGFESGNDGSFTSAYSHDGGPYAAATVAPGEYAVVSSTQASAVASAWVATNHSSCSTSGRFLVVNGATGQTGKKLAWSQTVAVVPGKEYRFCANFRNLPQCAFDVKPNVEIRFSTPSGANPPAVISASATNACDWIQESRTVQIPAGVVLLTTEIWLDETGLGDGNDLAIDDLSLQEMQPASPAYVQLNIASANMAATTYELTATPANGQPYAYYWEVCEVDSIGNCIAATQVMNPPQWWVLGANNFKGYVGTSALSGTTPAAFVIGKKYRIKYGVFGLCTSWTESRWYFSFHYGASKVSIAGTVEGLSLQ